MRKLFIVLYSALCLMAFGCASKDVIIEESTVVANGVESEEEESSAKVETETVLSEEEQITEQVRKILEANSASDIRKCITQNSYNTAEVLFTELSGVLCNIGVEKLGDYDKYTVYRIELIDKMDKENKTVLKTLYTLWNISSEGYLLCNNANVMSGFNNRYLCKTCNGTLEEVIEDKCGNCNGTGVIKDVDWCSNCKNGIITITKECKECDKGIDIELFTKDQEEKESK